MFIVYAIRDIFMGIVKFFALFARGLFIALKFRALEFDSKLQYKFPGQIRALIWIGIAIVVGIILFFVLGFIGDKILSVTDYTSTPAAPLN